MKISFVILVFIHGLLHIIGFSKAFEIAPIKELNLPISIPFGILWLLAAILFLWYGVSYAVSSKNSWIIGFLAIIISQVIVLFFWKDAKFGSLPNFLILIAVLFSYADNKLDKVIAGETKIIVSQIEETEHNVIIERDLHSLPQPVQKWIRASGILGKEHIHLGWIKQKALLKLQPDQKDWYKADAIQYSNTQDVGYIWTVKIDLFPLVTIKGRDKFIEGKGEMLISLNPLVNVVNEKGLKLDEGSMQRYLGELVWFPSLALSNTIEWEEINYNTAKATMNYMGLRVSGTFYFNEKGDIVKFTTLRYMGNEPDAKHYPWTISVYDYSVFEGIRVPSKMKITWSLEEGDWTWMDLEVVAIKYNEPIKR